MKKSIISIILGIAAGVILFAVNGYAADTVITSNGAHPSVGNNKLAWQIGTNQIGVYDLETGAQQQINPGADSIWNPVIWGNNLVWRDSRGGNLSLYFRDLSTGAQRKISDLAANGGNPAIWGNNVVWEDDYNIYYHNLSTQSTTQLTNSIYRQQWPAIWDNKIVWADGDISTPGLYMYDINTGTPPTRIVTPIYPATIAYPSIWKNEIIWMTILNGNYDLYFRDLTMGTEKLITTNPTAVPASKPAIWDNNVVWMDQRSGYFEIFRYDLSENREIQMTTGTGVYDTDQYRYPAIWGHKIFWEKLTYGVGYEIYLSELPTYPISGYVKRPDGQGINGVNITISGGDAGSRILGDPVSGDLLLSTQVATTNDSFGNPGYYEVKALEGTYTITP